MEVQGDWAAGVLAEFESNPGVGCIGGKVVPIWGRAGRPEWMPMDHYGPLALQDHGDRRFSVGSHDIRACLIGANFAVRRSVFDRIGLFSAAFLWGEDREFQLRAWERSILGMYAPDLVAVCPVPDKRVTKRYQRQWFTKAGRVHARMQLLERMDRHGALVSPQRGRPVLRMPGYLLRELGFEVGRWLRAVFDARSADAFGSENRIRYLVSYLAERRRHPLLPAAPARTPERLANFTPGATATTKLAFAAASMAVVASTLGLVTTRFLIEPQQAASEES